MEPNNIMLKMILELLLKLIIIVFAIILLRKRNKNQFAKGHYIWAFLFLLYIMLVFNATGAGSILHMNDLNKSMFAPGQINFIPIFGEGDGNLLGVILDNSLNIIMCIPLGILLPVLWNTFLNGKKIIAYGFFLSLYIELTQLLNIRVTDVNDLIFNSLGAAIGYLIYKLLKKTLKRPKDNIQTNDYQKAEKTEIIMISLVLVLIQQFVTTIV
jgi:glycopeptide antibiotics resistance protein